MVVAVLEMFFCWGGGDEVGGGVRDGGVGGGDVVVGSGGDDVGVGDGGGVAGGGDTQKNKLFMADVACPDHHGRSSLVGI